MDGVGNGAVVLADVCEGDSCCVLYAGNSDGDVFVKVMG